MRVYVQNTWLVIAVTINYPILFASIKCNGKKIITVTHS